MFSGTTDLHCHSHAVILINYVIDSLLRRFDLSIRILM